MDNTGVEDEVTVHLTSRDCASIENEVVETLSVCTQVSTKCTDCFVTFFPLLGIIEVYSNRNTHICFKFLFCDEFENY